MVMSMVNIRELFGLGDDGFNREKIEKLGRRAYEVSKKPTAKMPVYRG
ncbi:MAG: hypothetical protein J7K31_03925 [Candidatus Aenigmarchaeota archaeon]|nr:hypothetical protein [Candidatus Aenigmarchaeota archaeon]